MISKFFIERPVLANVLAIVIVLFILGNGHEAQINFLLFDWKTTVRFAILVEIGRAHV